MVVETRQLISQQLFYRIIIPKYFETATAGDHFSPSVSLQCIHTYAELFETLQTAHTNSKRGCHWVSTRWRFLPCALLLLLHHWNPVTFQAPWETPSSGRGLGGVTQHERNFRELASWAPVRINISLLSLSCVLGDTQPLKAPVHDSSLKSYFNLGFDWWQGQWKGKENRMYQTKTEIRTVLVYNMFRLLFKYIHIYMFTSRKDLPSQKEKNKILFAMEPLPATSSSWRHLLQIFSGIFVFAIFAASCPNDTSY